MPRRGALFYEVLPRLYFAFFTHSFLVVKSSPGQTYARIIWIVLDLKIDSFYSLPSLQDDLNSDHRAERPGDVKTRDYFGDKQTQNVRSIRSTVKGVSKAGLRGKRSLTVWVPYCTAAIHTVIPLILPVIRPILFIL